MTAAERRQADVVALLLQLAGQLLGELAQVRGELDAMDRGLVEVGQTGDRALSHSQAVSRHLARLGRIAGLPADPDLAPVRLAARTEDPEAIEAAQDLPLHGVRALPGGVA